MTRKRNVKSKKGLNSKLSWQKSKDSKMIRYRITGALVIQMMKMIMLRKTHRIKTITIQTQVKEGNATSMRKRSELTMTHKKRNNMMMTMMTKKLESLKMLQSTTSQA